MGVRGCGRSSVLLEDERIAARLQLVTHILVSFPHQQSPAPDQLAGRRRTISMRDTNAAHQRQSLYTFQTQHYDIALVFTWPPLFDFNMHYLLDRGVYYEVVSK